MPELLKLAEYQEELWEEIKYIQEDPSTWVQASWWSKRRAKIIGTILAPGVGTIIGHQIDLHDRREQDRQNAAKRDAYNQGVVAAEISVTEQKVLAANGDGPDGIFHTVVVQGTLAIG